MTLRILIRPAILLASSLPLAVAVASPKGAQAAPPTRARPVISYAEAPVIPAPVRVQAATPGRRFQAAPMPNRELEAPGEPRASNEPQFSASLFTRRDQYRGEGITPNSSAQAEQERRLRPGAGFLLKMPLQQSPSH